MEQHKYETVCQWLKSWIGENQFSDRVKIPSENMLCRRFAISRQTARRAVDCLCEEKLLYRVKGSGTYINKGAALSSSVRLSDRRQKVGLILQGQDRDANATFLKGLKAVLETAGVDLQVFFTDNRFSGERECLAYILGQPFDGVIVDGVKASLLNPNLDCYRLMEEKRIPVLFYNNYYQSLPFPKVIINDQRSADGLMKLLMDAGHRHIAGIFLFDNYQSIEKYKGYVCALVRYGGVFSDDAVKWCVSDDMREAGFSKEIERFLKRASQCTAIICCNYMILCTVLDVLRKLGKSVPEDMSIACFDYSNQDWEQTGIACTVHPGCQMGMEAGRRILRIIERGGCAEEDSLVMDAELYAGRTVAPPR